IYLGKGESRPVQDLCNSADSKPNIDTKPITDKMGPRSATKTPRAAMTRQVRAILAKYRRSMAADALKLLVIGDLPKKGPASRPGPSKGQTPIKNRHGKDSHRQKGCNSPSGSISYSDHSHSAPQNTQPANM
ncbi:hypothetical protein, partial [Chromobacterium violaceum]|uniref:hypothetical protein n=1 Tax=Chromobacterium violaceum TaxID=536 RepID=UPI001A974A3B